MGLHWSLPLLEQILPAHLWEELREAQTDPHWEAPEADVVPIYNGLTGDLLKNIPIPKTIRYSRRKMRANLTKGVTVKVTSKPVATATLPTLMHRYSMAKC